VFVGQADEHGTKTMYIKAAAGAVARNDAKLAAIADALAVLGDTRPVQARRAEAVGIMPDSLFTEELLAQARAHRLTHPTPDAPDSTGTRQTSGTPGASEAAAKGSAAGLADASGTADATEVADRFGPDPAAPDRGAGSGLRSEPCWGDEDLLRGCAEAGADAAAGHGAPHPSVTDLPDPFDVPPTVPVEPLDPRDPCGPGVGDDAGDDESMDAAARRALHARLAQIKHDAHTQPTSGVRVGPGRTEIYLHLTDHTLATGTGVLRVEGLGPMIADQLTELVGHGPYLVKPVIDLNDAVSVNAYEIPEKIRERVKLTHPVELFPYGTRETTRSIDLDHIQPYDPLGPPGQTATTNLAPLGRFGHRVKTHAAGWTVRRVDYKTLEWTTPHGFRFHVDPTGTHRIHPPHGEPDTN
jgi:hypothetical protein